MVVFVCVCECMCMCSVHECIQTMLTRSIARQHDGKKNAVSIFVGDNQGVDGGD